MVFETTHPVEARSARTTSIVIHTWGNDECCLAAGTTEAFLYTIKADQTADAAGAQKGDFLLFEEVVGPLTGLRADANPAHRQMVQLDQDPSIDRIRCSATSPSMACRSPAACPDTPAAIACPLARCGCARAPDVSLDAAVGQPLLRNVTVARGNIVLADHGLTTSEIDTPDAAVVDDATSSLALSQGPVTMQQNRQA